MHAHCSLCLSLALGGVSSSLKRSTLLLTFHTPSIGSTHSHVAYAAQVSLKLTAQRRTISQAPRSDCVWHARALALPPHSQQRGNTNCTDGDGDPASQSSDWLISRAACASITLNAGRAARVRFVGSRVRVRLSKPTDLLRSFSRTLAH